MHSPGPHFSHSATSLCPTDTPTELVFSFPQPCPAQPWASPSQPQQQVNVPAWAWPNLFPMELCHAQGSNSALPATQGVINAAGPHNALMYCSRLSGRCLAQPRLWEGQKLYAVQKMFSTVFFFSLNMTHMSHSSSFSVLLFPEVIDLLLSPVMTATKS